MSVRRSGSIALHNNLRKQVGHARRKVRRRERITEELSVSRITKSDVYFPSAAAPYVPHTAGTGKDITVIRMGVIGREIAF